MRYIVTEPIGAEVADLDLTALDATAVEELRELLSLQGVLVLRDQAIDDEGFLTFLRSLGELTFTKGEASVPGFPDLNEVSNVGRSTPPSSNFHVDTSYVSQPPAYTALRAVTIPEQGGETLFTNQYRAYDELPSDVRDELAEATITHVVTGVTLEDGDESSAEHRVFRPHPRSGQTALYLTSLGRMAAVSGQSQEKSRETLQYLFARSTREENTFRHRWAPGDVVIWDNGCVLHRADHGDVVGDRVMRRGMVASYGRG